MPNLTQLDWLNIVKSVDCDLNAMLMTLDKGEKHTLNMALKMKANSVIIDEKIARNIAEYMGLSVTGTLGVLLKAKQQGKISSFSECALAMQKQGIYYNIKLLKKLALQIGEVFKSK